MSQGAWKGNRATWDQFGASEPYWGVLSHAEYTMARLDAPARDSFFQSGERDIADVLTLLRQHVQPDLAPRRALDYGCGVGRLTIPLARACAAVVGVDVSAAMLQEARRNGETFGVTNADFVLAGTDGRALAGVEGRFDFINSHLVFQHIPPALGESIAAELLGRLEPGGVGALHFTYQWRAPAARQALHRLRRSVPLANAVGNLLQRRPLRSPAMPMYAYDLGRIFALLQAHGCERTYVRLMDHAGHLGAQILFQLPPSR